MTFSISYHRPGVDECPGIDERGHGLTMSVIHDGNCCREWETGQASTPARAQAFRTVAARWGTAWPAPHQPSGADAERQAEAEGGI